MPQIESQNKRVRTNRKSELVNRRKKSALKTSIANFKVAVEENDKERAEALFNQTNKLLDKSITGRTHHRNFVNRKKSEIARLRNTL